MSRAVSLLAAPADAAAALAGGVCGVCPIAGAQLRNFYGSLIHSFTIIDDPTHQLQRERVLFIGTQFSNLYTESLIEIVLRSATSPLVAKMTLTGWSSFCRRLQWTHPCLYTSSLLPELRAWWTEQPQGVTLTPSQDQTLSHKKGEMQDRNALM
jgi:hypothetical protein